MVSYAPIYMVLRPPLACGQFPGLASDGPESAAQGLAVNDDRLVWRRYMDQIRPRGRACRNRFPLQSLAIITPDLFYIFFGFSLDTAHT